MYMIGVQIYYIVYDRRTRVLYVVAVAVAEYAVAVAVAGLCFVIYRTMLCDIQDYAVWYTRLCCVICRTIQSISRTMLYGIQYYTIWYTILYCGVYNTILCGIQYYTI